MHLAHLSALGKKHLLPQALRSAPLALHLLVPAHSRPRRRLAPYCATTSWRRRGRRGERIPLQRGQTFSTPASFGPPSSQIPLRPILNRLLALDDRLGLFYIGYDRPQGIKNTYSLKASAQ